MATEKPVHRDRPAPPGFIWQNEKDAMATYDAKLMLTDEAGKVTTLTGTLAASNGDQPPAPSEGMDFKADFNAAPLGPLTAASKALVWTDPHITSISEGDPDGQLWSIVAGGRDGGQCARAF